jgi:hypothetical protein
MKPFNLEAAQRGEKMITRAGEEAEFIAYVPKAGKHYQVLALVGLMPKTYDTEGSFLKGSESTYDLFMAPKKKTVWVNFFPCGEAFYHDTEEAAVAGRKNFYDEDVAIGNKPLRIEIEE